MSLKREPISVTAGFSPKRWLKENRSMVVSICQAWGITRLLLMFTAWFSAYFPQNAVYQRYVDKGFQFTPIWPLDIWCRWDSAWYLSIAKNGYVPSGILSEQYSNLAFFPLYPYLVRALTVWLPDFLRHQSVLISVGLLLSNVAFLLAMFGIYELARQLSDESTAQKAVMLTFCLPGAFFFGAFYTESLFLFLTVYAFLAAENERWVWAAVFSMLAALTRANGILILVPILWIYMEKRRWQIRKIRRDLLWFLSAPAGVLLHFLNLYRITGNFFAFFEAQSAWGRSVGGSLVSDFLRPLFRQPNQIAILDLVFITVYLLLSIVILIRYPRKAYGVYALLTVLVLIRSGMLFSMTRYTAVIFPVVIYISLKIRNRKIFGSLCLFLIMLQILLYAGWVNYYWIA